MHIDVDRVDIDTSREHRASLDSRGRRLQAHGVDALARPLFMARLLTGLTAAVLCALAVWVSIRVLRHWRVGASSEGQLALERRAELVATLVQAGLMLALLGLTLTVLAADRSADAIRGAMCAYGVFDSTAVGFAPLLTAGIASLGCALWLVLHRLDLRLQTPVLTRTKFLALFVVAPLVWIDAGTFVAFSRGLDFDMVASCCSVGLDGGAIGRWGADSGGGNGALLFWIASGLGLAAAAALLWASRDRAGSRFSALAATFLSLGAAAAMLPAVLLYVAPHAYETPHHLCPFCLLHADVGGIGWPLFGSVFLGTALGAGAGLVELLRARAGEPDAVSDLRARLGRWGAFAWTAAVLLAAAPVIRFSLITEGASLFP